MKDTKEEQVSKIAKFLLAGGKMLGIHCGKCGSPLFERERKIVCPVCGELPGGGVRARGSERVREVLERKLAELAEELERESDRERIVEILDKMRGLLEELERISR
jgi:UPF0148 protein